MSETMARLWMAFVLVVALAAVACEAIIQSRYEDIVNQAIEAYNNGRPGMPPFHLIDYTVLSFVVSVGHPSQGNMLPSPLYVLSLGVSNSLSPVSLLEC